MKKFQKISYNKLNARQQENFNFQKISALLADYGFTTLRLSDDWQGADFIANHINGETFLKVQLKSRFTFDKKYIGKDMWICFRHEDKWYLFPHDAVLTERSMYANFMNTPSWKKTGLWHSGTLSQRDVDLIKEYIL